MIERYNSARKNRERASVLFAALALSLGATACHADREPVPTVVTVTKTIEVESAGITTPEVIRTLGLLAIKEAEPDAMDDYNREKDFGSGFRTVDGCNTQDIILKRDLTETVVDEGCEVQSGWLKDPYTGGRLHYIIGNGTGDDVQIDHVVALGNAWQTGADENHMDKQDRIDFANDGLNLQAVDGKANAGKGDKDAEGWLPDDIVEQCRYVARQILVKLRYVLSVSPPEHAKMEKVLANPACANEAFVIAE